MRVRRQVSPIVAITQNENESLAIEEGLNLINFSSMIRQDDVVVITPNWVGPATPESGRVVGPQSLQKLIQLVKATHPKRIVVATGPGQEDVQGLMEQVGFLQVIEEEQVEFINLNKGPFISLDINHPCPSRLCLNKLFNEMTFLISFKILLWAGLLVMNKVILKKTSVFMMNFMILWLPYLKSLRLMSL